MAHDVFVSYASSDKAVADAVCSQLESIHRIRCWIAPRDVTPGASWAESIIDALDNSKIMVLIFSSNANASMQIEREVERAVHKGINIIPLRIENTMPTKTLEYFISAPHWLDALSVPLEQHINKLAASVKALLARHQGPPVQRAPAAGMPVPTEPQTPAPIVPKVPTRSGMRRLLIPALVVLALATGFVVARLRPGAPARPAPSSAQPAAKVTDAPVTRPAETSVAQPANPNPTQAARTTSAPAQPANAASQAAGASGAPAIAARTPAATNARPSSAVASTPPPVPAGRATAPGAGGRAALRVQNLAIELDDNLPEGSIKVDIDGAVRWTDKLAKKTVRNAFTLPTGTHEITVTLFEPTGKMRETKSTKVSTDPGIARTVKVRLSRFRRNLEFETVVTPATKPETPGTATGRS
jgi:hypothetical protein